MTDFLLTSGTAIVLADTTDHAPGATAKNNLGTRTDQIDLTSLAAAAYRQSDKIDFGNAGANWEQQWYCKGAFEWSVAPTATGSVEVYIGYSGSSTAGQDNPGSLGGADAAWNGYGAASTDADEVAGQLTFIGSCPVGNDAAIQVMEFGLFVPKARYGTVVVRNSSDQSFIADAVEMSVLLAPVKNLSV